MKPKRFYLAASDLPTAEEFFEQGARSVLVSYPFLPAFAGSDKAINQTLQALKELNHRKGRSILLDSGGFSIFTRGLRINVEAYVEFAKAALNMQAVDLVISLDDPRSAKRTLELYEKQRAKGLKAIFVDHVGLRKSAYERKNYYQDSEIVAIASPFSTKPRPSSLTPKKKPIPEAAWQEIKELCHETQTEVHLLANRSLKLLLEPVTRSADAVVDVGRFGQFLCLGRKGLYTVSIHSNNPVALKFRQLARKRGFDPMKGTFASEVSRKMAILFEKRLNDPRWRKIFRRSIETSGRA